MPEDRAMRSADGTEPPDATAYDKFRALARKLFAVSKSDVPPRPKRSTSKNLKPEGSK
jgi:hypothetical protein